MDGDAAIVGGEHHAGGRSNLMWRLLGSPTARLTLDPRFITLWEQRERAQNAGNTALAAEVSAEILALVSQRAKAVADDVKLQTNEQIKYGCTLVNTMAASVFTAGVATPLIGIFAPGSPYAADYTLLAKVSFGCFLTAMVLHMVVRAMLRRLKA